MNQFYYGLGIGIIIGANIGFMMCIALRELKRMSWEHHLMSLPEPDDELAEKIRCNITNNRKINAEQKRKDFKIVKG
jgi:hypothetical protein